MAYSSEKQVVTAVDQNNELKGTVLDESLSPVIGASVLIKGTKIGTITDMDGNFSLPAAKKGDIIEISSIGFEPQEIKWDGKALNITLKTDNKLLDEVVVVGYGTQKKVNQTGAVTAVKGKELETRPVADASQSLQGLVPGLTVSNGSSGRPGASGTLNLRGQGNLSGTSRPYVLVDGVEMNLSDINPNDIESISVLKDAAAGAIYGARAAYGVILVTTKKGKEGQMRINYQGSAGWSSPTVLPEMADALCFVQFWNDGVKNTNSKRLYSPAKIKDLKEYVNGNTSLNPWAELKPGQSLIAAFENSEMGLGNVDYFKLHYKQFAFKQSHSVNFSGGNKLAQFYISTGLYDEGGILRYADMNYKRYTLNVNVSSQITSYLKLKLNTKYIHSQNKTPFNQGGIFDGGLGEGFYHSLARFRPTISVIDPNGYHTELSMIPYLQSGTYTNTQKDNLNITYGLELTPLKNWNIFFDYTYKLNHTEYDATNIPPMIPQQDPTIKEKGLRDELGIAAYGKYTRADVRVRYKSINLYTNYTFSVASKHNFVLMAGFQEELNAYKLIKNSINDLYSTSNPNLGMGTGDKLVLDVRNGWATRGFFGRINYDYKGKYLLELNGRYDGSSRFDASHRWGFFPSVSLGWNIHKEQFMEKTLDWLSNLKLRASWGKLGNQAGAALYTFSADMSLSSKLGQYIFADGRHNYTNAAPVVNPNTTWEKVESKNIGIDFGFFKSALTGSLDIFQRDTKDMLGPGEDYPDMFGASAPQTNNASMRNRGWEFSINYRGNIAGKVDYSIGGNISDATAVVTQYSNPTFTDPAGRWYTGRQVGEIWGYKSAGLIQTEEVAKEYNKLDLSYISKKDWEMGDVMYKDLNGDGKIDRGNNVLSDMGDQTIIGNSSPRYQYSINGSLSLKGFTISALLQGVGKRDWNPGGAYFWGFGPYAQVTVFKQHMDYWTPENKGAYYPKPYINGVGGIGPFQNKNIQTSDRYLQKAAYLRLKNVTLTYTIPESLTQRLNLSKCSVYLSGENLLTFTKLKGMYDPEAIFTGNTYTSEGGKNYPMNKVFSIGAIINF